MVLSDFYQLSSNKHNMQLDKIRASITKHKLMASHQGRRERERQTDRQTQRHTQRESRMPSEVHPTSKVIV